MTLKTKTAPVVGFKVLDDGPDGAEGTFEAIVAVFNNVDHVGDRILPGAFAASLEEWDASGDPIPVIFSHRWDDLDAHIGEVLEAEELLAGDERLPAELKDLGGLYVKAALDLEESFAKRVWRKLRRRTLREFSFAYEVVKASEPDQPVEAGHRVDLEVLGIQEVGPTLKGCNPATALLGAKARAAGKTGAADLLDELGELADLEDVIDDEVIERAIAAITTEHDGTELDDDDQAGDDLDDAAALEELEAGLAAATEELVGSLAEVLTTTARAIVEAAFLAASTTAPAGAGTLPGQEDEASAGDKGRPVDPSPATIRTELDLLELDAL